MTWVHRDRGTWIGYWGISKVQDNKRKVRNNVQTLGDKMCWGTNVQNSKSTKYIERAKQRRYEITKVSNSESEQQQ